MQEEFQLLGAPFDERGQATDEYLDAFKALWTGERSSYQGRHVAFEDVIFAPKPIQKPHPPIWVGGESAAALRRVVKLGDAWYPGNNNQVRPLDTVPRLRAGIDGLHALARAAGRDPASLGIALLVQQPFEWTEARTQDGTARRLFTGSSDAMAADAAALEKAGIEHVALRLGGASVADAVERVERFGREVIGLAGAGA
jgi:alkanesulfonate monooxygenase SsuD/methylene tetrahydromethanopterin reductase-like flavin-dependent oxidoreductase (luciferase family)